MRFSLRSKLVAFFLALSALAVVAISAYLLFFYGTDKRSSLRQIELSAFHQRAENLESLIQFAQVVDSKSLQESSDVIFVVDGACDPTHAPQITISRRNQAHLSLLGLIPSMWTNSLDFFLACKRVVDARAAGKAAPDLQLLPSKIDLAVPYLALLFGGSKQDRLALLSMDRLLSPSGARVLITSADKAVPSWESDPKADVDAAIAEARLTPARMQSAVSSHAQSGHIELGQDTLLSFSSVLDRWRLVSLAHLPMISESVRFAIRQIVFLAIGMLSLNALVGLRFAELFVRPLEELRASTQEIGAGNLDFRFEISGRDEIQVVKRSFNTMTEKIAALIKENREKAELDSELTLAREVGAMLFPKDQIQLPGLEIGARMNRSEQFSGEWWGYLDLPATRVVLLADLQQSGTLGALAIAALRGSAAAVEAWMRMRPELAADPCAILKTLGDSLAAAGRGTFRPFLMAAVFDSASGQVRCARVGPQAMGGIWIGAGGAQTQTISAGDDAYNSFAWQPGAKLLLHTPRILERQSDGSAFTLEALDQSIGAASTQSIAGLLSKVAQARAAAVKAVNYTMVACEATPDA